jgi:hypothetical protein
VNVHDSPVGYSTYREGRDWPDKGFEGHDEGEYIDLAAYHEYQMKEIELELKKLVEIEQEIEQKRAAYQTHDGARQAYQRLAKIQRAKSCGVDVKEVSNG